MQRSPLILRNILCLQRFLALRIVHVEKLQLPNQQPLRSITRHSYQAQKIVNSEQSRIGGQKTNKLHQKITLIAQNQAMTVTTLEEAQKLAKRRELHLVRIQTDAKSGRAVYKLATAAEMLADEETNRSPTASDKTSNTKAEKSLTIGTRIADHDLSSRLKNIVKWLDKNHEVRILVQASGNADDGSSERIVKSIEQAIKEPKVIGKVVQKRSKGGVIKFSILPVLPTTPPTM